MATLTRRSFFGVVAAVPLAAMVPPSPEPRVVTLARLNVIESNQLRQFVESPAFIQSLRNVIERNTLGTVGR